MLLNKFLDNIKRDNLDQINAELERTTGVVNFLDSGDVEFNCKNANRSRDEYGDWQTNYQLAESVCLLLKEKGVSPKIIIEPTCGCGSFILAALKIFDSVEEIYGIEIYKPYINILKTKLLERAMSCNIDKKVKINILHQNIFDFNFSEIKNKISTCSQILILGNPPWATNSKISSLSGKNLPIKHSIKGLSGISSITGKANFDIAETITSKFIEQLSDIPNTHIALLLKNSVIKNLLRNTKTSKYNINEFSQYNIDSKKEFNVAVSASLAIIKIGDEKTYKCKVKDFYTHDFKYEYGWYEDKFVANIALYNKLKHFDGTSPLEWWSGVKHDCSKIMELTIKDGVYYNGLDEIVDIEPDMIYPLIKSSDIQDGHISSVRKYVIITQKYIGEDTSKIKLQHPRTYEYLKTHHNYFEARGSKIYADKSQFSIFGIGKYSFKPYKIAVSGLYKNVKFSFVPPINGKTVMFDDTCYFISFDNIDEALAIYNIIRSNTVSDFIKSIIFLDDKRVINKDLLMRINLSLIYDELKSNQQHIDEKKMSLLLGKTPKEGTQLTLF